MSKKKVTKFSEFGYFFRKEHTYVSLLRGEEGEYVELNNTRSRTVPNLFVADANGNYVVWTLLREIENQLCSSNNTLQQPDEADIGYSDLDTVGSRPSTLQTNEKRPCETVTDWQIYWADFGTERAWDWPPEPPTDPPFGWWRTNNSRLVDSLREGDRLWLFTSGKLCGLTDEPAAYQVFWPQVLRVERWDQNPDYRNPTSDTCDWRYRVWAQDDGCLAISPPLLVEDIIFGLPPREFPPARGQTAGERLQAPRRLDSRTVQRLRGRLRRERGLEIV